MHLKYLVLFLGVVGLLFVTAPAHAVEYRGGELIKIQSSDAVYYVGTDLKRYVFPGERIYKTWYENFNAVVTVSSEELTSMPLAGVVRYRPGTRMVKIPDDPKVYVVGANGSVRHIANEDIASALYGSFWNKKIDDLEASLFVSNYRVGEVIARSTDIDVAGLMNAAASISVDRGLPVMIAPVTPSTPTAPTSTPPSASAPTPVVLGAVEDIEIARSDSNIIYLASKDTSVGVWKTKDGGKTWSAIRMGSAATAVAVHATNPDTALIADGGKMYRTTNGGATWTQVSVSSTVGAVHSIVFGTVNPSIAYGLSEQWLIKSADGGVTWSNVSAATNLSFTFTDVLYVHPLDDTIVFAGSTQGVQRSTDGGLGWTQLKPPTNTDVLRVRGFDSNPLDPFVFYLTTELGLWYTADNASSWNATRVPDVPDSELYDIEVADHDTNIVYVLTKKGVFKSTNRAASWEAVTGNLSLADVKTLAIDSKDENRVLVGTRDQGDAVVDGEGVYLTADSGVKWSKVEVFN